MTEYQLDMCFDASRLITKSEFQDVERRARYYARKYHTGCDIKAAIKEMRAAVREHNKNLSALMQEQKEYLMVFKLH